MKGLFLFFIRDKLIVNLIVISILGAGIFSIFRINREIFPATEMDSMRVAISYPGGRAEDVELNAVVPVEEVLDEISGVKNYRSISRDNRGRIFIELDDELKDVQAVKDEIYRSVSLAAIPDISEDVESIDIATFSARRIPVLRFALAAHQGVSRGELYTMSDTLEKVLKKVDGVSGVTKGGYLNQYVNISLDPVKLDGAHVAISEVVNAIKMRNLRQPAGSILDHNNEEKIIVNGQFASYQEAAVLPVRSSFEHNGLQVSDIADVTLEYEESDTKTRANGLDTVVLTIRKKENADSIKVVDSLYEKLEECKGLYSKNFDIVPLLDTSESIREQIRVVITNATIGFILVLVVLLFFLDLRTSFWTAFSIPLCLLIVIVFLVFTGNSINIITLGAIITVLGMLVDDAIVVAETIYYKKEMGVPPLKAALEGLLEVLGPVAVTIISTIIAFMPMTMIGGRMGKFILLFPVVITVTLLSSLFEATFILPNHLAHSKGENTNKKWFARLQGRYTAILAKGIEKRYEVLIGFIIIFIAALYLSFSGLKSFKLSREHTSDRIIVDVKAPISTSLVEMEERVAPFEQALMNSLEDGELRSIVTEVGELSTSNAEGNRSNWATIDINLSPSGKRDRDADAIMRDLRKKMDIKAFPRFDEIVYKKNRRGPDTGNAIDIKVLTRNTPHGLAVTRLLEQKIKEIDGVKDISLDYQVGEKEIHLVFDYDKLAGFGLTVADVASTVRAAYAGTTAGSIRSLAGELDFAVELTQEYRTTTDHLMNLLIKNGSGKLVRLGEFATFRIVPGEASIRHYNGDRSISITADVDDTIITPMTANGLIREAAIALIADYPDVALEFEGEERESRQALGGIARAFLLAIVMIYLIVLMLFRSAGLPLLVMSVVPFGVTGVFIAFWFHGIKLTFMALVGIVGLSGVVVNDSIIMVEFINSSVRKSHPSGHDFVAKICAGAGRRLRPIILTTVTTVAGLMPTVYGVGGKVPTLIPTVMAMAYGLLFATLLTLFFVPVLYMIGDDLRRWARAILGRVSSK